VLDDMLLAFGLGVGYVFGGLGGVIR
jgi:hypothetical protein